MGGGGVTGAMNSSIRANKALRRGRNTFFERPVQRSFGNRDNIVEHAPVSKEVREKFALKFVQERRMEVIKLLLSILLGIGLVVALYYYGRPYSS